MAFEKAIVSCGLWNSSYEEVAIEKAEDRLVNWLWLLKNRFTDPTCHTHS